MAAQRVGRRQQHRQRGQGAEHHADDHAGQQQAQCVLHAARQRQRQQHCQHGADEGGAGQPEGARQWLPAVRRRRHHMLPPTSRRRRPRTSATATPSEAPEALPSR